MKIVRLLPTRLHGRKFALIVLRYVTEKHLKRNRLFAPRVVVEPPGDSRIVLYKRGITY